MQNNDTIKSGDIYCGQERKTGKYFAYQIIDVKKEIMTYLLLDYFDEKFPDEKGSQGNEAIQATSLVLQRRYY